MNKNFTYRYCKSVLIKIRISIAAFIMLISISSGSANAGDTTWVTTFNQNFQNWADTHYDNFLLPDTNTRYEKIIMFYTIGCPAAGCDPWDRIGWIKLYTDSTTNYEIARVVTPYNIVGGGYPGQCVFEIDVTDYMSLLHDSVRLGSYIESWIGGARGWLVTVKFAFIQGEPEKIPYKVINLWQDNRVVYGDPQLNPEDILVPRNIQIDQNVSKAKVKIITTGHGQGNTDNAAEFSLKIHTLRVGTQAYDQVLWRSDCSINPCSPQGGTWQYARAGWCPGAGVIPWDNDVTANVTPGQSVVLDYDLYPYENFCRPTNPLCISGQTCIDCNYNVTGHTEPHYTIQGQLVLYKDNPAINIKNTGSNIPDDFKLYQNFPNPFNPSTKIKFDLPSESYVRLIITDINGKTAETPFEGSLNAGSYESNWNASGFPSGIYFIRIEILPDKSGNLKLTDTKNDFAKINLKSYF
ncbi:MAG: T9SS type A sorting domain-containing protein [Ignavibacteria bacterium]|nr:T9SS type A sorting domain-containing protein [Ignavibacteria bacterium]